MNPTETNEINCSNETILHLEGQLDEWAAESK